MSSRNPSCSHVCCSRETLHVLAKRFFFFSWTSVRFCRYGPGPGQYEPKRTARGDAPVIGETNASWTSVKHGFSVDSGPSRDTSLVCFKTSACAVSIFLFLEPHLRCHRSLTFCVIVPSCPLFSSLSLFSSLCVLLSRSETTPSPARGQPIPRRKGQHQHS